MYSVYASQNGSIALNNCLTLSYDTVLRVILCSRSVFSLTPLLITNIQSQTRSPLKKGSPKKPQKGYKKILRGDREISLPAPFYAVFEPHQPSVSADGDYIFDIKCKALGPCFVRIIWLDREDRKIHDIGTPLNFLVWNQMMFNIKKLTIQTILPNLVRNWDLNGFQAFHLCPIQQVSHSLYAIKDQLSIQYFKDFEELHNFIASSKKIFFIDIVLNHTAVESDWLDEEECVYNQSTVPQLASALELDLSLDRVAIFEDIENVILSLKLEEYFQLDLESVDWSDCQLPEHNGDTDSDDDDNIFTESHPEKVIKMVEQYVDNFGVQRFGVKFYLQALLAENDLSKFSIGMLTKALQSVNCKQLKRAREYVSEAISNIQAHYKKYGCVQRYFHKLKRWYAAYNGYVINIDPEEDFVTSQNFHYLRHTVQKWNVIKLRYGDKKDTPLLLGRMSEYVQLMARYFNGFRLDNCHGTPLDVSQYLLKHARQENPKLLIFAELFGCSYSQQVKYMSKLGLNGLVSELCYSISTSQLKQKLENHQYHQNISPPQKLIYDQTHDNQPPIVVKYGAEYLVALVSALSFSNQFKGTTKMVDEFYDRHISCVYETRFYPQTNQEKSIIERRQVIFMYKHNVVLNNGNNVENGHQAACPNIVKMKGSFDNWQQEFVLSNKTDNPKYYTCSVLLTPGTYQYKFIVDDVWTIDELQQHNEMNNVIEVTPIKAYQSLTFIRQLAGEQQFQHTYIEAVHSSILVIYRCSDDHISNQIIVICLKPIIRKIQMPSKIKQILYQYSYAGSSDIQNNLENEIPPTNHYIDISTQYVRFEEDTLSINTPTAYVLILDCEPHRNVVELNEFCNTSFVSSDLNLLYQPLVNHYDVPGCGTLSFSGLYGVMRCIEKIETLNDPFIKHIKEGDWLLDYLIDQHEQLVTVLSKIKALPQVYKPFYFIRCVRHVVESIEQHYSHHQEFFYKQIDVLSSYFTREDSTRGRDTFMSFKGILLLSGKFIEGRELIIKYGTLMQHGLIPNSLKPLRYNTRDTCFWWIKAIRDYVTCTEDYSLISQLQEQIQCVFQSHATGINFKETHVLDDTEKEGLIISLQLDPQNGFIMGGSYKNCLTWMDKMGSGCLNQGYPAASRDGAPIECTALLKACVDFVNKLFQLNKYPYPGIKIMNRLISWKAWSDFICQHFEKSYYVPLDSTQFTEYQCIDKYVRRKGIYRDIFGCSKPRSEYQLRPNSCIAIALAPELFQRNHVIHHLALVEQHLMGANSLGLSTLDSIASEYSGKYTQLSDKFSTQGGFSLHNGSEFVFLTGYYLKALLKIHKQDIKKEIFYAYLAPIKQHLKEYYSLPDFTDSNGQLSEFAQKNSILSVALLKEAIFDLEEFSQKNQK